jgi:HK97 family phage prohead protease
MKELYSYKSVEFKAEDVDLKNRKIKGYASAFNVEDRYKEVVMPGAFKKSIEERGPKAAIPEIKFFLNHDITQSPARVDELYEDNYGLGHVSTTSRSTLGKDFLILVEEKIVSQMSIGYELMDYKESNGVKYITEKRLWEISGLTGWGVNKYTPIDVMKSTEQVSDRIKKLDRFVRNTTASDETIAMLMIEIKQLSQYIIDLKAATKPEAESATSPEVPANENKGVDWNYILQNI